MSDTDVPLQENASAEEVKQPTPDAAAGVVNNEMVEVDLNNDNRPPPLNIQSVTVKAPEPSAENAAIIKSSGNNDVLFAVVRDIILNLIFQIPSLRSKLNHLLETPDKALNDIKLIYAEVADKIPKGELDKIQKFIGRKNSSESLVHILHSAFSNITADGKIDVNDSAHFITLIYEIITLFNDTLNEPDYEISIDGETIMHFLHFLIKCTLILTLEGQDEETAVLLLDAGFKLVSVVVMPLKKMKCSCNPFACCKKNKKK